MPRFLQQSAAPGLGIIMKGKPLKVLKALDKESVHKQELQILKNEALDRRNLYLGKEGEILAGIPAAEGLSESDMKKREMLMKKKAEMLQSPKFHVKLLKDVKKGKAFIKKHSRGVGFVDFKEHEHALVALRVLNDNPKTFGPDHCPIAEFAFDSIQKLRQQKAKLDSIKENNCKSEDGKRNLQQRFLTQTTETDRDKVGAGEKLKKGKAPENAKDIIPVPKYLNLVKGRQWSEETNPK
ncbi:hypothetical protein MUK42_37330 [Musa troglodytarum]|uniref:RRM domain-containing protein n=1 Tax=Musa troglodytarum TaxID=320322 RepID=A0A9E7EDR9_9LILI|nr:hypothetical protein MUK42_37330 [Musa troglodytarum]